MMFFGNPLYRLASGVVSIVILVVVYFTVIKPTEHTVTNAINQGFKTFHHGIVGTGGTHHARTEADKLARCLRKADGRLHKVQLCDARFQP